MSIGCVTGARHTPDRTAGDAPVMCYKITALKFLRRINQLSSICQWRSLLSRLCYKISGPSNIPF